MLSLACASLSFAPHAVPAQSRSASLASAPAMIERSEAIPFLKKPAALDGSMAGDVGFDPLGFTTTITELGGDLKWVREAELMHGRQAMFATVGMVAPSYFKIVNVDGLSADPLTAQYELPSEITVQVFLAIAVAEGLRSRIVYGGDQEPGEHFTGQFRDDLIKRFRLDTPEAMMQMKTKEIKHCRLAMIAVTGMFFQQTLTGSIWPLI